MMIFCYKLVFVCIFLCIFIDEMNKRTNEKNTTAIRCYSPTSQLVITWSVVVDPRNVVHAMSISLVNFIGDRTEFA